MVFAVGFEGYELGGGGAEVFVGCDVVDVAEALQDVEADEGAVLFGGALLEALDEAGDEGFALGFAGDADLPEGLHAVAGGDEALVFGNGEEGAEVFAHAVLGVAGGEGAECLGGDGSLAVVAGFEGGAEVVPDLVGPVDGLGGGLGEEVEGLVLTVVVGGVEVSEVFVSGGHGVKL